MRASRYLAIVLLALGGVTLARAEDPKPLSYDWREVGTNHWQIKTAPGEDP